MTTIQDLIEQWRRASKASAALAKNHQDDRDDLWSERESTKSAIYARCADDLEKALAGIVSPTGGGVAS